ncbi:MAG: cysteine--tRNA ligase [Myxococcales bacterium]|nr:cysteine--tRNA ligase [Myxococcales bacterium]MCB9705096.1 cysteine--tRNA ligase [Myxococcales bacterium]
MAAQQPPIVLYDTLSASKRPLELLEPGRCRIYTCGPTVYDMSHIGHARAAIVPDVLVRTLRELGVEVTYARNVTDIDDKIIRRAAEEGSTPGAVAERYTAEYHRDLADLGCLEPDVEPRVTAHVPEIISMIEALVERGLAYASDGDVYYRVAAFAPYGALSKRSLEDMQAGARVEVNERKENPLDFVLWKGAKPGEPAWASPWGEGRPGWHIECSAMSRRYLGDTFDVHVGGRDLIFPHHENEIAQSQGACGVGTFARHWVHNGFVDFAGEKMSKSLGNFFTIREVTALYPAEALRFFLLGVHYRSGINFDVEVPCPGCGAPLSTDEQHGEACPHCGARLEVDELRRRVRFPGLEEADDRVKAIYETLERAQVFLNGPGGGQGAVAPEPPEVPVSPAVADMLSRFRAAMSDDLNTAAAIACLSEPLREVNRLLVAKKKEVDPVQRRATIARFLRDMAAVSRFLGIFGADPGTYLRARRDRKAARLGLDTAAIEALLARREQARAEKRWKEADALRDELASRGVVVNDAAGHSSWTL